MKLINNYIDTYDKFILAYNRNQKLLAKCKESDRLFFIDFISRKGNEKVLLTNKNPKDYKEYLFDFTQVSYILNSFKVSVLG